jgi:uncharacterized protein YoxC
MDAASKEKGHLVEEVSRLEADLKVESSDLDTVRDKNTELTAKIEQLQSDFQEKSVELEKVYEKIRLQTKDNDNAQREKTEIASKLDELTQRLADESREHDQERESWTQSSSNKDKRSFPLGVCMSRPKTSLRVLIRSYQTTQSRRPPTASSFKHKFALLKPSSRKRNATARSCLNRKQTPRRSSRRRISRLLS